MVSATPSLARDILQTAEPSYSEQVELAIIRRATCPPGAQTNILFLETLLLEKPHTHQRIDPFVIQLPLFGRTGYLLSGPAGTSHDGILRRGRFGRWRGPSSMVMSSPSPSRAGKGSIRATGPAPIDNCAWHHDDSGSPYGFPSLIAHRSPLESRRLCSTPVTSLGSGCAQERRFGLE